MSEKNHLIIISAAQRQPDLQRVALRVIDEKPVLSRMVTIAKEAVQGRLNDVVTLTDSEEAGLLAERESCRVHLVHELNEKVSSDWFCLLDEVAQSIETQNQTTYDVVMVLRATSPLLKPIDLIHAFDRLWAENRDIILSGCEAAWIDGISDMGGSAYSTKYNQCSITNR